DSGAGDSDRSSPWKQPPPMAAASPRPWGLGRRCGADDSRGLPGLHSPAPHDRPAAAGFLSGLVFIDQSWGYWDDFGVLSPQSHDRRHGRATRAGLIALDRP